MKRIPKSLDMADGHCQDILDELPPKFHTMAPIAERRREILYPLRDGVIWTETDNSPMLLRNCTME